VHSFRIAFAPAIVVLLVFSAGIRAGYAEKVLQSWEDEYRYTDLHIKRYSLLGDKDRKKLAEQSYDPEAYIYETDRDPLDVVIRRTEALIEDLKNRGVAGMDTYAAQLTQVKSASQGLTDTAARRQKYREVREIQRRTAFANPLLDMDTLLFNRYNLRPEGSHMVLQYLKCGNLSPARICYLLHPFSDDPEVIDILEGAVVENGEFQGQELGDCAIQPDLSFDGKKIAFAHDLKLFSMNLDGSNLRQLTDGKGGGDWDPCWLPGDERLVFVSLRRGGSGRCHTKPTFCMYGCKSDGTDLIPISYHETNEWHPSINNDGKIVYCRWDYVDRDSDIAHHIWICGPDGTDPRAPHGNYPHPFTTLEGVLLPWYKNPGAGRESRPWMEMNIRAIPNSPKYVATAAPHHDRAFGSLVVIDPRIEDDGVMSQVKRITPLDPFPEAEARAFIYLWGTPWPLSEDFFLCSFGPHQADYLKAREKNGDVEPNYDGRWPKKQNLYLLDRFGNTQLLWEFEDSVASIDPIPVRPRPNVPRLPTKTFQGERSGRPDHYPATISVTDVYESDMPWPEDVTIKWMRIVQIFPSPSSVSTPSSGPYGANTRMSLGIVPVEDDGSVNCKAPVEKAIYFQLLDENRRAVHSMRSDAFVHPGEQLSCLGCHEDRWSVPPTSTPKAQKRPPSHPMPEPIGLEPISFPRHIRPIFESKNCQGCHREKGDGPQYMSYDSLAGNRKSDLKEFGYLFFFHGSGNGNIGNKNVGGSRTIPGYFGARYSRMGKKLMEPAHRERLTNDEFSTIMTWLDCNSMKYGTYQEKDQDREEAGELVWPEYDVTLDNIQGLELFEVSSKGRIGMMNTAGIGSGRIMVTSREIRIDNSDGAIEQVQVISPTGRMMRKKTPNPEIQFHLTGLGSGMFIVAVHHRSGKILTQKFTSMGK